MRPSPAHGVYFFMSQLVVKNCRALGRAYRPGLVDNHDVIAGPHLFIKFNNLEIAHQYAA